MDRTVQAARALTPRIEIRKRLLLYFASHLADSLRLLQAASMVCPEVADRMKDFAVDFQVFTAVTANGL
jgi:hypothetical protein